MSLVDRQRLRLEQLARIQHLPHQRAFLSGPLYRLQQRDQLCLILCASVLFQCFAQRQVLKLCLCRHAMRIRRHKRERAIGIPLILCQMKRHSTQQIPHRVDTVQPGGWPVRVTGTLLQRNSPHFAPESAQNFRREIFQSPHRRSVFNQLDQSHFLRRIDTGRCFAFSGHGPI